MSESLQHVLDRVRSPRVQITYDVEIGNAIQMKELPFVVGILADLSGKQENPLPILKERKFVEIDRDNFNDILTSVRPRLAMSVANKLGTDDEDLGVELFFQSMDDFSPIPVVKQVGPLNDLYTSRVKMHDLLSKLEGNDQLHHLLAALIAKPDLREALKKQLADAAAQPSGNAAAQPAQSPPAAEPAKDGGGNEPPKS